MSISSPDNIEKQIIIKAQENPDFKQRLLNNTKEVFEEELGQKLPEDLEIIAVQQSPQKIYITLPMNRDELAPELSQEELEAVAGGGTPAIGIIGTIIAGGEYVNSLTSEYKCFL
jgi:hypothetical protein